MKHKITHRIYPEEIYQLVGIQHISLGLTHLAVALQKPRMPEYLLRKRKIQRHQEDRPIDRMETDDILSDQMKIRGPILPELLRACPVTVVSNSGNIVTQRVQPYINHMPRIEIHRNSPSEGGSGHTQILKPRKQEIIHHLIFPRYRLNKFRMCVDMLDKTIRVFAHLEEICLFLRRLYFTPAVRTFTVYKLRLRKERLAGGTIHSLIIPFVNISLLIHLLEYLLNLLLMILIRCTDEFIVGSIHQIPDPANLSSHLVHVFLRRNARFFGF